MSLRCLLFCACAAAAIALAPSRVLLAQAAPATSVQLPSFGIAIDAQGVLTVKEFNDPAGRLMRERQQAAQAQLPGDVARPNPLRKVALRRLEAAVAKQLAAGKALEEAMRYLAGLQRLQYVFFYPEEKEIVVAGPAEGWRPSPRLSCPDPFPSARAGRTASLPAAGPSSAPSPPSAGAASPVRPRSACGPCSRSAG